MAARRFSSLEMATAFLADDVGLSTNRIEQVVDELKRTGAGSIFPVTLTTGQLKKLGLI